MKSFLAALCLGGLVLPLVLEATLGCTLLLDGGEAVGDFADNTYTCRCVCTARMLDTGEVDFPVCMTPELNPNLDPGMGTDPTAAELEADCEARVQANIQEMGSFCRVGPMLTCDCAVAATTQYVESCDDPCLERPLLNRTRCEDFALEEAFADFTNTEGLDPVCLSGGEEPVPLGTALFGGLSTCDVSGDATVDVDDKSKTVDAVGSVAFDGGPCPGQSCDVGMIYRLDMDSIEFSGLFGLGKVRVEDLLAAGGTAAAAASVDSLGQGSFPPQAARSSGQGTRRNFFAGVETGSESGTVAISNPEPIAVRVNWQGRTCTVEGSLSGATVEGESALGVSMDLFGSLVNQPPSADAGDDRAVECTSPQDTTVDLDGSGSEDPDANIVFATWFRGGRLGDEIGSEFGVEVGQGLGVAEIYYLKVVDAFLQASEDSAVVLVVERGSRVHGGPDPCGARGPHLWRSLRRLGGPHQRRPGRLPGGPDHGDVVRHRRRREHKHRGPGGDRSGYDRAYVEPGARSEPPLAAEPPPHTGWGHPGGHRRLRSRSRDPARLDREQRARRRQRRRQHQWRRPGCRLRKRRPGVRASRRAPGRGERSRLHGSLRDGRRERQRCV
jgi:hypothetical protein